MDKPMSNFSFKAMTFILDIRDLFRPTHRVLSEVDMIKPGAHVLDYGCGPGNYTIAAAKLVGPSGKVYAVDILGYGVCISHILSTRLYKNSLLYSLIWKKYIANYRLKLV
jgi:SAM-dependent methyltransferase